MLFLSQAIICLGSIVVDPRHCVWVGLRHTREPVELSASVDELCFCRADLSFAAESFLGTLAGLQHSQLCAGLVELTLQRGEPRLKFVLPKLCDQFAFG